MYYVLISFPKYVVWRISRESQEFLQLKIDWKKEIFGHKGCNFDLFHPGWLGLSKSLEVWHFAAAELSKRQTEAESYFISIARYDVTCSLSSISNNFDNANKTPLENISPCCELQVPQVVLWPQWGYGKLQWKVCFKVPIVQPRFREASSVCIIVFVPSVDLFTILLKNSTTS